MMVQVLDIWQPLVVVMNLLVENSQKLILLIHLSK